MSIKLDNFVIQMVKGEDDELKPGAVIRFNIGEGDKMKQFEHMLDDEESQETLDTVIGAGVWRRGFWTGTRTHRRQVASEGGTEGKANRACGERLGQSETPQDRGQDLQRSRCHPQPASRLGYCPQGRVPRVGGACGGRMPWCGACARHRVRCSAARGQSLAELTILF